MQIPLPLPLSLPSSSPHDLFMTSIRFTRLVWRTQMSSAEIFTLQKSEIFYIYSAIYIVIIVCLFTSCFCAKQITFSGSEIRKTKCNCKRKFVCIFLFLSFSCEIVNHFKQIHFWVTWGTLLEALTKLKTACSCFYQCIHLFIKILTLNLCHLVHFSQ